MFWVSVRLRNTVAVISSYFLFSVGAIAALENNKRVAIIHSYAPPSPWYFGINKGFTSALSDDKGFEISPFVFELEVIRRGGPHKIEKEKKRLLRKVKAITPDLVVVCDDEANDYLSAELLNVGFPVIILGINRDVGQLQWLTKYPHFIGAVLETYPLVSTFDLLQTLTKVRRVSIITSAQYSSQIIAEHFLRWIKGPDGKKAGISLGKVLISSSFTEWIREIPNIGNSSDAIFVPVPYDVYDQHGVRIDDPAIIAGSLRALTKIPTVGVVSIHAQIGLLLSISTNGEYLGRQAGELAHRYLSGSLRSQGMFEEARYHVAEININEASRLGIKIPPDLFGFASLVK